MGEENKSTAKWLPLCLASVEDLNKHQKNVLERFSVCLSVCLSFAMVGDGAGRVSESQ